MTNEEFKEVAYLLKNGWPGQFAPDNEAVYAEFLLPFAFDAVKAALHGLAMEGQQFVPSVGVIVAAVRGMVEEPVPSWTEAWAQIETAMRRNAVQGDAHEVVAAFVAREGLQRLRLSPFYDPDRGDMRIHQLHARFDEFADGWRAQRVRQHALRAAGMKELERARVGLLERSVELGR